MARSNSKNRVPEVGMPVVFYPDGKVGDRRGVPAIITQLQYDTDNRLALQPLTHNFAECPGVFHISVAETPGAISEQQRRDCGLWAFTDEHRTLHDAEVERIEARRAAQVKEQEQRLQEQRVRQEALLALKSGMSLDDVAEATGMTKSALADLAKTVVV